MTTNRIIKSLFLPLCLRPSLKLWLASVPFALCLLSCHTPGDKTDEAINNNADSLTQLLSQLSGTEKIDTLNSFALRIMNGFPDSSRYYSSWAISMSDSLDYQKGLGLGYLRLGNSYFFSDSLYLAMTHVLTAARILEQTDPVDELAYTYTGLSYLHRFTGRFQPAIDYKQKAIDVYEQTGNDESLAGLYQSIAWMFMELKEFDSAIFYNEMALTRTDTYYNPWIHNNFGTIYLSYFYDSKDTSMLDRSVEWFKKGLELTEKDDHQTAALNSNLFHAYYAYRKKETDSLALYHLDQVIPSAGKTRDAFAMIPSNLLWRAKLLYWEDKFDSANVLLNEGLEIIDSALSDYKLSGYSSSFYAMNNRIWLKKHRSTAYYWLYRVYNMKGNHKKALEYYIDYKNAEENIYQDETKNLVSLLEAESENEKTEKRIAMLEQDNRFNQLKVAQSRNFMIGMGILLVVLILMGVLFLRQNKLKNEHKSTLLEQKLLRLQMNPHFIFNALSNIMHAIEENENKNALSYLHKFSKLLRTTLESSREDYIMLEDEIKSTEHYLELQKLRYEDKFAYSIETDEDIDLENAVIPPMLIQPFIENAIEHGIRHKTEKGHIIVRFNLKDQKIVCEIEDDGVGREKAWEAEYKHKEHKSLATSIILDRIQAINRKMKEKIKLEIVDLKSDLNEPLGTKVVIDIPLV